MASYNHFVTDPYAVLTIQLTMLFIYSGLICFCFKQIRGYRIQKEDKKCV